MLDIDARDKKIISMYIDNPDISQSDIASKLKLSQPSVNFRVSKLKKRGLLSFDAGISMNRSGLLLARVDFIADDAKKILQKLSSCPYFVNGFTLSGRNNISVFLVNDDLKKLDEIVSEYLRKDSSVSDINMNLVVSSVNDLVFKLDLDKIEGSRRCGEDSCRDCKLVGKKVKFS